MKSLRDFKNFNLKEFDTLVINYLSKISLPVLRVSLGIIFIWFGALKPFGNSPANDVITKTIYWFDPDIFAIIEQDMYGCPVDMPFPIAQRTREHILAATRAARVK